MDDTDYIVNSVLCFINSAHADYTFDSLLEVTYSFYSHEEIKVAKETLCTMLKKDLVWRRDPDKKRKDLKDVLDYHQELITSKRKVNIVTNSYKKMPPVGMAVFAPILSNLADDLTKINEVLPKILDIKTEVINTADTVRQMKVDIVDIRSKFRNAISGMQEASKSMCDTEVSVMEELRSFRRSLGPNDVFPVNEDIGIESLSSKLEKSYAGTLTLGLSNNENKDGRKQHGELSILRTGKVTDPKTGAISKFKRNKSQGTKMASQSCTEKGIKDSEFISLTSSSDFEKDDDWVIVKSRNKIRREKARFHRNDGMTGSKKIVGGSFKAAVRTADVFIGRVDNDVTEENVAEYIRANFALDHIKVTKLEIKSSIYAAFKVNVKLNDRDKLFNEDLWPEDIVVNKFYNRYRNNTRNDERSYNKQLNTQLTES